MRFRYEGDDVQLQAAVEYCNSLYENSNFWDRVTEDGPFDFTDVPSENIANFMRSSNTIVEVRHFRPRFFARPKYRKTVAFVSPSVDYVIFYHTRYLGNSVAQMINTLVHEHVHVIDFAADGNGQIEYTHSGQSSNGNSRSAPYAIGALAENFYRLDTGKIHMAQNALLATNTLKSVKAFDAANTLIGNSSFCGVDGEPIDFEEFED